MSTTPPRASEQELRADHDRRALREGQNPAVEASRAREERQIRLLRRRMGCSVARAWRRRRKAAACSRPGGGSGSAPVSTSIRSPPRCWSHQGSLLANKEANAASSSPPRPKTTPPTGAVERGVEAVVTQPPPPIPELVRRGTRQQGPPLEPPAGRSPRSFRAWLGMNGPCKKMAGS